MTGRARFIRSIIRTARECDTVMPYARGARRRPTVQDDSPRLARSA